MFLYIRTHLCCKCIAANHSMDKPVVQVLLISHHVRNILGYLYAAHLGHIL